MSAATRISLERALRERGEPGVLHGVAIHNVRLHVGTTELYGREDWLQLETDRYAAWGPRSVSELTTIESNWGAAAKLIAARWQLGADTGTVQCACLTIVHEGRIVREWQFFNCTELPALARSATLPRRGGVPWEYGEVRPGLGQLDADSRATAIAPPAIAGHPVVLHWHRRWNLREGEPPQLLFPFESPVMFCERLVVAPDGHIAALQWRLVGRIAAPAWGLAPTHCRLELPGLSFFQLEGPRVASIADHFDLKALADQAALRAVS